MILWGTYGGHEFHSDVLDGHILGEMGQFLGDIVPYPSLISRHAVISFEYLEMQFHIPNVFGIFLLAK